MLDCALHGCMPTASRAANNGSSASLRQHRFHELLLVLLLLAVADMLHCC